MSRTRAEKSNFSLTCSRLSLYLKEKGCLPDLSMEMNCTRESKVDPETPKTMDLLPGLGSSGDNSTNTVGKNVAPANTADTTVPHTAPMTIFYGGRVTVFDNFPADMAKELFATVCKGSPAAGSNTSPRDAAAPASTSGGGAVAVAPPQKPALPLASDLPIARRISLNRFLEKRKDRISSKAPYQVHASPDVVSASLSSTPRKAEVEQQPWLALAPSKLEGTF